MVTSSPTERPHCEPDGTILGPISCAALPTPLCSAPERRRNKGTEGRNWDPRCSVATTTFKVF